MKFFVLALLCVLNVCADDWPQWLGPKRDAVWRESGIVEKFPEEFAARAQKPVPPPLPPEYTPEELIEEESIPTVPMAHDPGWEKAGAAGTI